MYYESGHRLQGKVLEICHLLIDVGADINKANNDGNTPLFYARQEDHSEIVKKLKNTKLVEE